MGFFAFERSNQEAMRSPRLGPRQVLYKDKHQEIYRVTANFGSFTKEYFVRDSGQRSGVVLVRDGSVLLVRQYRLLIDSLSWEIPGGKVDDGETPEAAAIRECWEEVGIRCRGLKRLLTFQPGLDTSDNLTYLFYTDNFVESGKANSNPQEVHHQEWIPLERCVEMVFAGQIVDSLSVIAILSYQTRLSGR